MSHPFTVTEAFSYLHSGHSCQSLIQTYLDRIAEREAVVRAWHYLDAEKALQQAIACDEWIRQRILDKPLLGIPIAVKDNMATSDMPTGWGTSIHDGTQLGYDAAVVARLRAAGAVIMGKTVLTEYAIARAGKTTNPHHPNHTPGGSSSGSAAAVAAGMVPLAIGTQTVGSILRPAAYCGVLGFKPSFGAISRYGVLPLSRDLDHVGLFAQTIDDLALLMSVLAVADGRDPDCWGGSFDLDLALTPLSTSPRIAVIQGTFWADVDPLAQTVLQQSAEAWAIAGATVQTIDLPPIFDRHLDTVNALVAAGCAYHFGADYDRHCDRMSPQLRSWIEQGRTLSAIAYAQARQDTVAYSVELAYILSEFDIILTPVTSGAAPYGLDDTGSSKFCALWSLTGLPAISIPAGQTTDGLPLAVQLVGQRGADAHVLAIARWAIQHLPANPDYRASGVSRVGSIASI